MEVEQQPRFSRTLKFGTVLASLVLVTGCSNNSEAEPAPTQNTPGSVIVSHNTTPPPPSAEPSPNLTKQYCGGDDFDVKPGTVVVDGRCDADPTVPIGVYKGPEQIQERAVARVKTGATLVAICFSEGQSRQNLAERASSRWIRVALQPSDDIELIQPTANNGDIPAVWTQGAEAVTKQC